eukprot:1773690-Prymnesium_polylepis.1
MPLVYEGSCSGMVRVCNDHEPSTTDPSGNTVCRPNSLGRKTVRIFPQNWGSAILNSLIAQILLMEQLQVPAEILQVAGTSSNYFVHESGSTAYAPIAYDWASLVRASHNPECVGFPSYLAVQAGNISSHCSHVMLELWSGQDEWKKKYVDEERVVEDVGNLGVLARVGWFIPSSTLDTKPELATYRGFKSASKTAALKRPMPMSEYCNLASTTDAVCDAWTAEYVINGVLSSTAPAGVWDAYFVQSLSDAAIAGRLAALNPPQSMPTPFYKGAFTTQYDTDGTTAIGHFAGVGCGWTEYDQQIISDGSLRLDANRFAGGAIRDVHRASAANNVPVLFYWWEPHALLKMYETNGLNYSLSRVGLQHVTSACKANRPNSTIRCADAINPAGGGCDYPVEVLSK